MRVGPVTDPVTKQRFDGGCDRWVDETFVASAESTQLLARENSLATQVEAGEFDFDEGLERDIEVSLASFDCMSEIGYHGQRAQLLDNAWQEFNS